MAIAYTDDPVAGLPVTASGLARRGALALAVGGALLAAYLGTILMPYLVNDLHTLPLAEVASGAHDPKDLWPGSTGWGGAVQLGAFFTLMVGPLVVLAAGAWSAAALVARRGVLDGRARVVLVSAVVVAVTFLALYFSPFGLALAVWRVD